MNSLKNTIIYIRTDKGFFPGRFAPKKRKREVIIARAARSSFHRSMATQLLPEDPKQLSKIIVPGILHAYYMSVHT